MWILNKRLDRFVFPPPLIYTHVSKMTEPPKQKRQRPHDNPDARNSSEAANFNARVLRKVQRALQEDPEVDISTVLPNNYPSRLASRKIAKG